MDGDLVGIKILVGVVKEWRGWRSRVRSGGTEECMCSEINPSLPHTTID